MSIRNHNRSNELPRLCLTLAGNLLVGFSMFSASQVMITGADKKVIEINPEKTTGLDMLFVVSNLAGCKLEYQPKVSTKDVKWYKFSNLGGGYAEEISSVSNGDKSILNNAEGDMGYIIEDGDSRYYFWVVDYSNHRFYIRSVEASETQDCDFTNLEIDGTGNAIHYFTINGQQKTLSRDIEVLYQTLEWSDSDQNFLQKNAVSIYESLSPTIRISPAVLCSTDFVVEGDRFLKEWGEDVRRTSRIFQPVAVEVHTAAEQNGNTANNPGSSEENDNITEEEGNEENNSTVENPGSNVIRGDSTGLGGSAPAEITFLSFVSDAVLHSEWQMSRDPDFNEILYRFNVQDLTYTFEDEGNYYLRFIGSNADGSCESVSDTYEVSIGASELLCPNAFSPDGDGLNDEWKVSYRSLTDFRCWIFDRYGHEMFHFEDPSKGWDGKYKGKIVRPGVYYYVIQATGADGKKYKKSGDINIIRRNVSKGTEGSGEYQK